MILAAAILFIIVDLIALASMALDENLYVYTIVVKIILNVVGITLLWVGGQVLFAIITIVASVVGLVANFLSLTDSDVAHITGGILAIASMITKTVIIILLFVSIF